ncbi:TIR domain-containing protein [Pseudomonas syringae]|uniref:TIR domain-containing protein n=1 Tax=Pseudomonas syringae TaxID=317 RepID=UPI000760336E|nr:nucleotide-binding protein [Pseudomonas syringae]KWS22452.1 nucleotide-binding protein [Pseudomonas syringae pv. syringae]MCH5557354.1 nucleotide-binding protein [Pseudomonas syringae pv. syringae]MCH5577369.1 nucleotide-binding protein [Pseudomonas syringae pv. syringae]MCH5669424.1 nucleotide-binding protein [Pseudomonas syringae pv. syringae]RXT60324.1 nucleotide-binding protein [Pseudomonas syringae]
MARANPPTNTVTAPKLQLTPQAIERGLARLDERISELENFNVNTLVNGNSPELTALKAAIKDTLERCFGDNTSAYQRFHPATGLRHVSRYIGGGPIDYVTPTRRNIANAVALLKEAQRTLREDLTDHKHADTPEASIVVDNAPRVLQRKVFVVHGHDEGARETVARFLMQLGFDPIILHEQANRGRTVMEKVEAHGEVGFAVVLLTPDDEGCVKGGTPEPRARQNVLLELGYFLGRLGRDKVCALKRGTVEIPSDFAGVVWESMDGSGWKQALGRELQDAGHEIDWNKVMRT